MRTMIAKYPGQCTRTGAPIRPGDTIVWQGRGRAYLADLVPATDPDADYVRAIDPELADLDSEAAASAGRYLRRAMSRGVSDIWTSGGREFYRNRRGRCEDAPCCGCCNA